jgi:hypothetical protein
MRLKVPLTGKGTNPLAISLCAGLWTLCGVTDSLQDRGLSGVGSSNDEHTELEVALEGYFGILPRQLGRDLTHPLITTVTRRVVRGGTRVR